MDTPNVHPHDRLQEFWPRVTDALGSPLESSYPPADTHEQIVGIAEELFGSLPASFHLLADDLDTWVVFRAVVADPDPFGQRQVKAVFEIAGTGPFEHLIAILPAKAA